MAGLFEIRTWPANAICHRFQLIDREKQKSEVGGASSNSFVHTEKGDLNFLSAEKIAYYLCSAKFQMRFAITSQIGLLHKG